MTGDDMTLVREFAASNSETAFTTLVERHLGLVHSAALRQTGGDAHLAEEIAQAVFIILARKAGTLGDQTILSAWLYRTTHYAAADARKANYRRAAREHEAYMQSTPNPAEAAAWTQLAPLLDDAMAGLGETDRAALVLRYFENKTVREIAATLRLEESAAQKRVNRALEKLRAKLCKQGVTLTGTIIAGAVMANSVQAAPLVLVKTISVVATTKGVAATASIQTLVKSAIKLMKLAQLKTAVTASVAAFLIFGTAAVIIAGPQRMADESSGEPKLTEGQKAKESNLESALTYLKALRDQGKLPGVAKDEHGSMSFGDTPSKAAAFKFLLTPDIYPLSWTFHFSKKGKRQPLLHYTIVKASKKDVWQLAKAWRTDDKNKTIEEFNLP